MNTRTVAALVCLALIAGLVGGLLGAEIFADGPGRRGLAIADGGDADELAELRRSHARQADDLEAFRLQMFGLEARLAGANRAAPEPGIEAAPADTVDPAVEVTDAHGAAPVTLPVGQPGAVLNALVEQQELPIRTAVTLQRAAAESIQIYLTNMLSGTLGALQRQLGLDTAQTERVKAMLAQRDELLAQLSADEAIIVASGGQPNAYAAERARAEQDAIASIRSVLRGDQHEKFDAMTENGRLPGGGGHFGRVVLNVQRASGGTRSIDVELSGDE